MPASTIAITPFNDIGCPVVVTSHGTSIGEAKAVALETPADYLLKFFFHPLNVVMDWVAGRDADKVIAISEHAENQLVHRYGFSQNEVDLITHGVDIERFYPREGTHEAVDPEQTTVLYVGRLGARKGLDLAIRALAELESPDVGFLIAGTGRHESSLRELSQRSGVADLIQFLGHIPDEDLPLLYSSADIFLLPSRYEGLGLVSLEAMACRTPVLGADAGGIPTAIDHGDTGLVFSRNRVDLTDALHKIIADDKLRSEMEKATAKKAESMSWQSVAEVVQELYRTEVVG
jgi:glycosyltransferase involved in cell wall biosynthesis